METGFTGPTGVEPLTLEGVSRIWLGDFPSPSRGAARLFRKTVDSERALESAKLLIFAESRYQLWVNGTYVGRGPVFHHPHRRPLSCYDVSDLWQTGKNTIAVLVFEPGMGLHNSVPSGHPGLTASLALGYLDGSRDVIESDNTWVATSKTGWNLDVHKRGWALAQVEVVNATEFPTGWQENEFDDSDWLPADEYTVDQIDAEWVNSEVPLLRVEWKPAVNVLGTFTTGSKVHFIEPEDLSNTLALAMRYEEWQSAGTASENAPTIKCPQPGLILPTASRGNDLSREQVLTPFIVDNLTPETGTVVCVDLGREYVGHIHFQCECETSGVIDIGWSEFLVGGKPPMFVKGVNYADRLLAKQGLNSWEPIGFSGARYIALIFRGFKGSISFKRLGMLATEPALDWDGNFECDDKSLNDIYNLCSRSIRVGTQETVIDCPTREQAPYIGDGNLVARWIALVTGDYRHWRYVVRETFVRQSKDGFLRAGIFTASRETLLDYNLLAVISAFDYLKGSGDRDTISDVLPGCRRVFRYFEDRRSSDGSLQIDCGQFPKEMTWENSYDPAFEEGHWFMLNFVDHPGAGAHNMSEPGIDRGGLMAALQALYVLALEALAGLEEAVGDAAKAPALRKAAEQTREATRRMFYCPQRKVFADTIIDGERSQQISQQTNVWCIMAGMLGKNDSKELLAALHTSAEPDLARSGPYFWSYTLPLMAKFGLHDLALTSIRELWGKMLDRGATTLWETFVGDELDTWCHPWSGAPLEFLTVHILGIAEDDRGNLMLRPRYDLLREARGSAFTRIGKVEIEWRREGESYVLQVNLPSGTTAVLVSPEGKAETLLGGIWRKDILG